MGRQRKKSKNSPQQPPNASDGVDRKNIANGTKSVSFNANAPSQSEYIKPSGKGMRPSPSVGTLNRLDRETYVLWQRPFWTIAYCLMEVLHLLRELLHSLYTHKLFVVLAAAVSGGLYYVYLSPGPHQEHLRVVEKHLFWCLYWVFLGVLSSVGFGTGLHTFLIYLGPHIARVTLAAYECNSLDFPEPPYPDDVTCPTTTTSSSIVSLLAIVSKVRLESLMWGAGTALGELPPYFMARAARQSGETPDDEEYREFLALMEGDRPKEASMLERAKLWMEEKVVRNISFLTILIFASVPNPFFDLAGITCGHFGVPFWTFFGATLIGKALVKMHVQMLFVVIAFSEHHVETLVNQLKRIPEVGVYLQALLKEFLRAQKLRFHRNPGDPVPPQASSVLQTVMQVVVSGMILWFLISILNSLAQRYHKRRCDSLQKKAS